MTPRLALTTRSSAWARVYSTSETTVVTTTIAHTVSYYSFEAARLTANPRPLPVANDSAGRAPVMAPGTDTRSAAKRDGTAPGIATPQQRIPAGMKPS